MKAIYDGQDELGIAIFELSDAPAGGSRQTELVFDPSGAPRVVSVSVDDQCRRSQFWMNEANPTFLKADPPASAGKPRFDLRFEIDENKRLLVTARDLKLNRWVLNRHPVVRLT